MLALSAVMSLLSKVLLQESSLVSNFWYASSKGERLNLRFGKPLTCDSVSLASPMSHLRLGKPLTCTSDLLLTSRVVGGGAEWGAVGMKSSLALPRICYAVRSWHDNDAWPWPGGGVGWGVITSCGSRHRGYILTLWDFLLHFNTYATLSDYLLHSHTDMMLAIRSSPGSGLGVGWVGLW